MVIDFHEPRIKKIIFELPAIQASHRKLWKWVSSKVSRTPSRWPGWGTSDNCLYDESVGSHNVINSCYACHVAKDTCTIVTSLTDGPVYDKCIYCPLDFGSGRSCTDDGTIFDLFRLHRMKRDLSGYVYARLISKMPFKISERLINEKLRLVKIN